MTYLIAFILPPLCFLFLISFFLAMTLILIPGALILWALCSVVAAWDLRKVLMNEHATLIADKMAAKLQQPSALPTATPDSIP